MTILFSLLEALLMVSALSLDTLVSGFAYGANKIKIPALSVFIINIICSMTLAVTLLFGHIVGSFIPKQLTTGICVFILVFLGISKIFDSAIKSLIRKYQGFQKVIRFSAFHLGFLLKIYANPEKADKDESKNLSSTEAVYLAVALSLDGLAVGFGAGMTDINILLITALSLLTGVIGILAGWHIGSKIAERITLDLSFLSGILLIVLALLKVFPS